MKVGRRLAMKLLNASRFALAQTDPRGPVTVPVDRAMLTSLARLVSDCTAQFDDCQYATVLERTERWFWSFCDDYLELVKSRRYGAQGPELAASANTRAAGQPLGAAAAVCAVSAVRHRGGLVVVAERIRPSRAVAARRPSSSTRLAAPTMARRSRWSGRRWCWARCARRSRKPSGSCQRRSSACWSATPDRHLAALGTAEADLLSSGFVEQLVTEEAETFSVEVRLREPEPPPTAAAAS